MKFNKGDLVIHARGTIPPHKNLQGVVVRADLFQDTLCPMYQTS